MKKNVNDDLKQDAFLREIAEDCKNDQLKSLWNQYGLLIILLVAAALTAAVSFETFKSWHARKNQELSNAYAVAVSLQNQGRLDESMSILKNLAETNRGVYGDISRLQIANIYFEQGKNVEAMDLLQQLAADKGINPQMRDIAAIKLASYKLDTDAPSEEIADMLTPLTKDGGSWSNIAHELLAMLAIRDGNMAQAKTEYEAVVNSPNVQDTLKARAQDMLTILNDSSKK